MLIPYKDKYPTIADGVFIAPTAVIIGDVEIASGANIWYGTVVRGDLAPIRIGANTNIQDNCTIHVDLDKPALIGMNVTIGHNAVVHGCTIEDRCLIGMNAVVLSGAHIRSGCVVGAGAVVKENMTTGPFQLLAGIPAMVKKTFSDQMLKIMDLMVEEYLELAGDHHSAVQRMQIEGTAE